MASNSMETREDAVPRVLPCYHCLVRCPPEAMLRLPSSKQAERPLCPRCWYLLQLGWQSLFPEIPLSTSQARPDEQDLTDDHLAQIIAEGRRLIRRSTSRIPTRQVVRVG